MLFQLLRKSNVPTSLMAGGLLAMGVAVPAQAVDWGSVATTEIGLFYPGQTSLEWIYSKRDHDGAARYKKRKKDCQGCHDGDQKPYGEKIVAGGATETDPIGGRTGYLTMKVQIAADGGNLHARLTWPKTGPAAVKQDADYETKVTVMIDDAAVEEYVAGGCWAVCHTDSKKMPDAVGDGMTKYLGESRQKYSTKSGGGDAILPAGDLQKLITDGIFLEYWQARFNPGAPAEAVGGYILSERSVNDAANLTATATEDGGNWVVEFSRPLAAGANQKNLEAGKRYILGFALHDQHSEGRYHLTSLQYASTLDGTALELTDVKE